MKVRHSVPYRRRGAHLWRDPHGGAGAALAYVLRHTAWGRHVYAVGDDPEAAELSGVRVNRMLIAVYTVAGLICALAGWALIGRIGAGLAQTRASSRTSTPSPPS